MKLKAAVCIVALSLTGCAKATLSELKKEDMGTATGLATGRGGGKEIVQSRNEQDKKLMAEAALQSEKTGERVNWNNPETGNFGSAKVLTFNKKTKNMTGPALKDRVKQIPPLEMVENSKFVATDSVNVRGGPNTDYKIIYSLAKDDFVDVVGKVKGKLWYMVERGDAGAGFVYANSLYNTNARGKRKCRTLKLKAYLESGDIMEDTVKWCQTPTGWVRG